MVEANAVEAADVAEFAIRETIDFLMEDVFYAFLAEIEFADKGIAWTEREFVGHLDTGNYEVDLLIVKSGETDIVFDEKLVASVLVVVLVVGVVDDAL